MKRYLVLCLAFAGCTASSPAINTPDEQPKACGIERWLVKNLADSDTLLVNFSPFATSIKQLASLPKVSPKDDEPRRADERQSYRVTARLTDYKLEDDGDIHIVLKDLEDSTFTLVAEIPNPDCYEVGLTSRGSQYRIAREWFIARIGTPVKSYFKDAYRTVEVVGVGYYDQYHGQRGMAKNNLELHPVLYIGN